jgi:DNA-binding NarL/FixJ family response regulator
MARVDVTAAGAIRIVVVDDHPAIRQGLALLLAPVRIEVAAEAGGLAEARLRVRECRPDLAVVDLSLDGEDGTTLIADFRTWNVPVLVYSMHKDARHVEVAFAAGALGYVTKGERHDVLVQGIREVAAGRRFVSPTAAFAVVDQAVAPSSAEDGGVQGLSRQEHEVYQLLGRGEGTCEIAAAMGISARTVQSYYARILVKLGLNGMYALRQHAISHTHQR